MMYRALLHSETAMWPFVRIGGLDPTNNSAEREVRTGMLYLLPIDQIPA